MAAVVGRLRVSCGRGLWWALHARRPPNPAPSYIFTTSQPGCLHAGHFSRLSSVTRPPSEHEHTDPAAAREAAEQGLRILRERSESLEQDDAVEAWRLLLKAACAETVPPDVYFALGNLHYIWGELLEFGKRAELGAEGAAKAVVAEIKDLRKQAMKKRQLAPGSFGSKGRAGKSPTKTTRMSDVSARGNDGRVLSVGAREAGGGRGTTPPEVDYPEAWEWYLKAALSGDTRAMMQLGDIALEAKTKSAGNAQHAEEWYRKAAVGNPPQPDACFQMARIHHEGIGAPCDPTRARELYDEALQAGSSAAAYFLGQRFHVGDEDLGIAPDGVRALKFLRQASEKGHAEATFYLAQAHRSGCPEMGLSQDLGVFGELVQQAAAAGSADALFALGSAFFHGEDGFARDPRAAFRCYSSAADDGHADASYCLGVMQYAMGDAEEAFRRYQTAAEAGNVLAWRNLAAMYALGEGVARSEQMAKNILATFGDEIERREKEEKRAAKDGEEKR
ncbi:conserved unknown protein [Ectocarpus siliculosus]|uniref:Sel1 domain protein repeat-containing protein n=1 Tax=Ectocarpus siliculosus TaxID=2880 RepID=D7FQD3_ECTSI|nr:conserved unknown protein [Ectocarpus siliculosus]|eukprot:CBJ48465.1 conserved unknown protein [Ectocarpus siliculosus]